MYKIILFLIGILSLSSFAQDGYLDYSFGDDGIVITDLNDSHDYGWAVVQQADQKLVVSGSTSLNFLDFHPFLIRYMPIDSLIPLFESMEKLLLIMEMD